MISDRGSLVVKEMERDRELLLEDSVMVVLATFNDKFHWIYSPGSDLFVAYNEKLGCSHPLQSEHPQSPGGGEVHLPVPALTKSLL